MKTLHYTQGYPVSDFMIERFFETHKRKKEIYVSNKLVVDRFRAAVVDGEIEEFKFVYNDTENGVKFECVINQKSLGMNVQPSLLDLNQQLLAKIVRHKNRVS